MNKYELKRQQEEITKIVQDFELDINSIGYGELSLSDIASESIPKLSWIEKYTLNNCD